MIGNVYTVKIDILGGKTAGYLCAMSNPNIKINSDSKGESVPPQTKKSCFF